MKKYRPSLTLDEIKLILTMLDQVAFMETAQILNAKLRVLLTKVDLGVLNPAYTTDPKPSMLAQLGEENKTPQQKREAAYIKYKGTPESCTDKEISMARTYMYENNMYTQEEREAYEKEFFGDI